MGAIYIRFADVAPCGAERNSMAIFYLRASIVSRGDDKSAVGAAAYRAGVRMSDERSGETWDYSKKAVIASGIIAPPNAPAWASDRQQLWNAVERAETRKDAQLARDFTIAIPNELTPIAGEKIVRAWISEQLVARGMVADYALHEGDGREPNLHAHVLVTMRKIDDIGFSKTKERAWNDRKMMDELRESWGAHANRALEHAGIAERIDHRSYYERGIDRVPQVHLGPAVAALEASGIRTDRGDRNRTAETYNRGRERDERTDRVRRQRELDRRDRAAVTIAAAPAAAVAPPTEPPIYERVCGRGFKTTVIEKPNNGKRFSGFVVDVDERESSIAIDTGRGTAVVLREVASHVLSKVRAWMETAIDKLTVIATVQRDGQWDIEKPVIEKDLEHTR